MAPSLRKRNSSGTQKQDSTMSKPRSAKDASKAKRKAADDASPVSLKKQKPARSGKKSTPASDVAGEIPDDRAPDTLQLYDSDDSEDEEADHAQALADELDSGDEAAVDKKETFKRGQDVGKIPKVSKDLAQAAPTGEPGVVYIGRIPHGFYEHEMRQYLSQFGSVTRVRLSRNKKTGASKHFAFVEFEDATTAEIVAKTMDNYILFGHILKCKTMPQENIHEDLFKGANRRFKKVPWNKMAGLKLQKPLTESGWKSKVALEKGKRAKQATKLKAIGYDFEAPELKDVPEPVATEDPEAIEAASDALEEAPAEIEDKASKPAKVAKRKAKKVKS